MTDTPRGNKRVGPSPSPLKLRSCYAVALTEKREYGLLAPVGGTTNMLAWLALALP